MLSRPPTIPRQDIFESDDSDEEEVTSKSKKVAASKPYDATKIIHKAQTKKQREDDFPSSRPMLVKSEARVVEDPIEYKVQANHQIASKDTLDPVESSISQETNAQSADELALGGNDQSRWVEIASAEELAVRQEEDVTSHVVSNEEFMSGLSDFEPDPKRVKQADCHGEPI